MKESFRLGEELRAIIVSTGLVLLVWAALLFMEGLAVSAAFRDELVASWEVSVALKLATPIALAASVPLALSLAIAAQLSGRPQGRRAVAVLASALAAALVLSLSSRALAAPVTRYATAAVVALVAGGVSLGLLPRVRALSGSLHAGLGLGLAVLLGVLNATVLVRLYAPLHAALLVLTLGAGASVARWLHGGRRAFPLAVLGLVLAILSLGFARPMAQRLAQFDNVRLFLLEHAPALGTAVRVAAKLSPPAAQDDAVEASTTFVAPARSLDWENRDIVLLSVDALRADHVSSYGYARPTTPNIDALAREGTVFEHAYCPTPHTSYSVTSMMTGKYMRPLLRLGVGDDSETFAGVLRTYGYKTAAFYPPAVFFIDEQRFTGFRDRGLDFEYRKVEFAEPELRKQQVQAYLAKARPDAPLFLWVHVFEPHEPYVFHGEHAYGPPGRPTDIDRYDSEIATADALIGSIVQMVRAKRKDPIFIITADHGEEFGDHGGHHHGTTVFEEQVRVPLVVNGRGVHKGRVSQPVQTIDIVPTVLSALGVPVPPRVRGRDLGPAISGRDKPGEAGFAFAETDDFALVAENDLRLVCERRVSLCTLYDVSKDPGEKADLSRERPADLQREKKVLAATELSHGRFEGKRQELPDALRRGLQGDGEAALDVAALLDDVRPDIRVLAAEVSFHLHSKDAIPGLERALAHSDEEPVKRWAAMALVRAGVEPSKEALALLHDRDARTRGLLGLAFAENGDARGEADLSALFAASRADFEEEKEILAALGKIRSKLAVPVLVPALTDVRLRPFVATALGDIGSRDARALLLAALATERYPSARVAEAAALVKLDGGAELVAELKRFAGVPEPMIAALELLGSAHLLSPERGAVWADVATPGLSAEVSVPRQAGQLRVLVLGTSDEMDVRFTVDGKDVPLARGEQSVFTAELAGNGKPTVQVTATVMGKGEGGADAGRGAGLRGIWVVPLAEDVPLPPPEAWDAGAQNDPDP
jgi:arylsulfatase A-like enzyme